MSMPRLKSLPPQAVRIELVAALKRPAESCVVHRLHAMLLISLGFTCSEIASWFGESSRTVERWAVAYEVLGLDGLRERHSTGRPSRLTQNQFQQLRSESMVDESDIANATMRWTGKSLARHIESDFGVQLSERQCQRLRKKLKASG